MFHVSEAENIFIAQRCLIPADILHWMLDDVINFLIKANSSYNALCYLQTCSAILSLSAQSPTLYQDNFIFIKLLVFNFFFVLSSPQTIARRNTKKPLLTKRKQEITETTSLLKCVDKYMKMISITIGEAREIFSFDFLSMFSQ